MDFKVLQVSSVLFHCKLICGDFIDTIIITSETIDSEFLLDIIAGSAIYCIGIEQTVGCCGLEELYESCGNFLPMSLFKAPHILEYQLLQTRASNFCQRVIL